MTVMKWTDAPKTVIVVIVLCVRACICVRARVCNKTLDQTQIISNNEFKLSNIHQDSVFHAETCNALPVCMCACVRECVLKRH